MCINLSLKIFLLYDKDKFQIIKPLDFLSYLYEISNSGGVVFIIGSICSICTVSSNLTIHFESSITIL